MFYIVSKKNRGRTTRRSENIEANVKIPLKIEVQLDFEDVENSEFDYFLVKTFTSKPLSSAKNHRGAMFYIFKTLSEPSAICQ